MLLEARRLVNPALEPLGVTLVDDVAVPRSKLVALLRGIAEIGTKYDVLICCPGHVGDGNMHPTVVFDRDDPAAEARALEAFGAVMELGLALGGTITGEHGIGTLKARWLETGARPGRPRACNARSRRSSTRTTCSTRARSAVVRA